MPLSPTQETNLAAALVSNGIDTDVATVATVLAALDEADLVAADKDSGVKADYNPAAAATVTSVEGQPGVQIITCEVNGVVVGWLKWHDPAHPGERSQLLMIGNLGAPA